MSEDKQINSNIEAEQERLLQQIRDSYSEAVFDRWRNPRNMGRLGRADGYGKISGGCGDTVEIFLNIRADIVSECTFMTDGCGATLACASMATELAQGKSIVAALAGVTAEEILNQLGGLPEGNVHCAGLAADTFKLAIADYYKNRHSPWKKDYRST